MLAEITNVSSEAGVIATLLFHPEYCLSHGNLQPGHFSDKRNASIYMALQNLAINNATSNIDGYMLDEAIRSLESNGECVYPVDIDGLMEFVENAPRIARHTPEEYRLLVNNILDCSFRRDAVFTLEQCISMCHNHSVSDIKEEISSTVDKIMSSYVGIGDVPLFGEMIDDIWESIRSEQGGTYSGIPFESFPDLNDFVTLEPGELICIGAQEKDGKSMFLTNVAIDLMKQDVPFVYVDSELNTKMFTVRLLSRLTGIPFKQIKNGNYPEEDQARIDDTILWIKSRRFVHTYVPLLDQNTLLETIKQVNHKIPLQVFIVDYFKSTGELKAFENSQQMGNLINLCKNVIAGQMKLAGIGACQINHDGSVAESRKIGRYVSTMLLLRSKTEEEIAADGGPEYGNKMIKVLLNRNGGNHGQNEYIDICFDGDRCLMYQAEKQHPVRQNDPYAQSFGDCPF